MWYYYIVHTDPYCVMFEDSCVMCTCHLALKSDSRNSDELAASSKSFIMLSQKSLCHFSTFSWDDFCVTSVTSTSMSRGCFLPTFERWAVTRGNISREAYAWNWQVVCCQRTLHGNTKSWSADYTQLKCQFSIWIIHWMKQCISSRWVNAQQ